MYKVKAITRLDYNGKIYEVGEVFNAGNNDTHYLIEHGFVELYTSTDYANERIEKLGDNKMMTPRKKKGYIIK